METIDIKVIVGSGNMAKFSHYIAGNLYYIVETKEGTFQFPIKSVDKIEGALFKLDAGHVQTSPSLQMAYVPLIGYSYRLSDDLGTTAFNAEIKAMELMRWIRFAIKSGELIKIS